LRDFGLHALVFGSLSLASGCRDLPEIARGECGNGVVEPEFGEDCDTFSQDGTDCLAADEAHACHFDCSGGSADCLDGWGCDPEGVCRFISEGFNEPVSLGVSGAASLRTGDFDGDGRADLLAQMPPDRFGRAPLQWFYFDARGEVLDAPSFPKAVAMPMVSQLSGDGQADVVFSAYPGAAHLQGDAFRIGVLLGRADRRWIPEAYSSYRVASAHMRMVGVYDDLVGLVASTSALAVLTTPSVGAAPGVYVPYEGSGLLELVAPLDAAVEQLIGELQTGNLFEGADSPCRELVLAMQGAQTFSLVDLCEPSERDKVVFRRPARTARIALEPPASIDTAPLIADLDGDGHLDVILGAGGRAYAAYGDGQALATAIPYDLPSAYPLADTALPGPLAVGDVTADGFPDFVLPTHLLLSHRVPDSPLPAYDQTYTNVGDHWTVARIADLNDNGRPDVIAASAAEPYIDFFSGTGTRFLNPTSPIRTEGPIAHLQFGDFDGDLINDLAYIQTSAETPDIHELRIAFGNADEAPDAPQMTARVRGTEQLAVYQEGGLGHLMLSSWDGSFGLLTLMYGTPDRIPFAPHTLVSFSADGDVGGSSALAALPGKFVAGASGQGDGDVLAIGTRGGGVFSFWLVEDISTGETTPGRLEHPLPDGFTPAVEGAIRPNVAAQAADFDGDGLDEALWLLPSTDSED
jgi:hypothetical protein